MYSSNKIACVAGAWKQRAKKRTRAREGDTCVSFSCTRFSCAHHFQAPATHATNKSTHDALISPASAKITKPSFSNMGLTQQLDPLTLCFLKYWRSSQTSLIRTPKGQNQVSALQRCPYYRGRERMIFGISGTKRSVRNRDVSISQRCP